MRDHKYVFDYAAVTHCGPGLIVISWGIKALGFGEMTMIQSADGLSIQSECMGKDFCRALLMKLVDDAELAE